MAYIAVVGPSDAADDLLACAAEVGALLGRAGAVVFTGGLAGVMTAATDAAAAVGAVTVALLPGNDRHVAPKRVTVAIPTGLGEMRNALLVRAVDAVIAVGGSWGTLSEIALARRTGVRVVCLGGWIVESANDDTSLLTAKSPDEAVRLALSLAGPGTPSPRSR